MKQHIQLKSESISIYFQRETPILPRYQSGPQVVDSERASQDFDELIFALKTGRGYDSSDGTDAFDRRSHHDRKSYDSAYESRRIAIADTHL